MQGGAFKAPHRGRHIKLEVMTPPILPPVSDKKTKKKAWWIFKDPHAQACENGLPTMHLSEPACDGRTAGIRN